MSARPRLEVHIDARNMRDRLWVMIGARDAEDAMREAARSTDAPRREDLEVWDGQRYVSAFTPGSQP